METLLIILAAIAIILVLSFALLFSTNTHAEKDIASDNARETRVKELTNQHIQVLNELSQKYGEVTAEISLQTRSENYSIVEHLYIFEEKELIIVDGAPVPFSKILSYTITDNQKNISTTTGTAETITPTGSMIGRALVGGVLLGGVGAVAGATTAKKETETNTTVSHSTTHNYIIYLTIEDLTNPQRILNFGTNETEANKAASIFNIIIRRNNTTN